MRGSRSIKRSKALGPMLGVAVLLLFLPTDGVAQVFDTEIGFFSFVRSPSGATMMHPTPAWGDSVGNALTIHTRVGNWSASEFGPSYRTFVMGGQVGRGTFEFAYSRADGFGDGDGFVAAWGSGRSLVRNRPFRGSVSTSADFQYSVWLGGVAGPAILTGVDARLPLSLTVDAGAFQLVPFVTPGLVYGLGLPSSAGGTSAVRSGLFGVWGSGIVIANAIRTVDLTLGVQTTTAARASNVLSMGFTFRPKGAR